MDKNIQEAIKTTQKELRDLNVDVSTELLEECVNHMFNNARRALSSLEYSNVYLYRFATWSIRKKYSFVKDEKGHYVEPKPEFKKHFDDLNFRSKGYSRKCGNCKTKDDK